jgi:hypothetical protein
MTTPSQEQLDDRAIPHVTFTSDMPWDPAKYDDLTLHVKDNDRNNEVVAVDPYIDPEYDQDLNNNQEAYFTELLQQKAYSIGIQCMDEFENVSSTVRSYINTMFHPVPNITKKMAQVCKCSLPSEKTWIEHNYGKTIDKLHPNFAYA